jgi:unsaturated rhamnogalacturonyl hydrolase
LISKNGISLNMSLCRRLPAGCVLGILLFHSASFCGQANSTEKTSWVGDAPTTALSIATDLSPTSTKKNVSQAMRKVGDWQLARAEQGFDQDWTFAALYAGFMSVPDAANGKAYREAMMKVAEKFRWELGPRPTHADDQAIGQTYLELYLEHHDVAMMLPTRSRMDAMLQVPDDKEKPLWWWCDALFMAPPVLAKLSKATGDKKYLDFMDREWWITSSLLYSPANHLYFRDQSFLDKHQANGQGLFWSRGNGWVFAGLARVLAVMPKDYPSRPKYVAQFREMAQELASIQGEDGLWRPGLLDAGAYRYPEISGSSFFTYGFAYGVNSGILERSKYLPIAQKAWKGLLSHVYQDGRLGSIQPIGGAPDVYIPTSSYVFGTGAFLLAGSEVYKLAH